MKISELMTKNPNIISGNTTILEAARKMKQFNCGVFPIGTEYDITGIITDRDIVTRVLAEKRDPSKTVVEEVMTLQPVFCMGDDPIEEAFKKMEKNNIRRILVIDKNKKLSGILSLSDVFKRNANHEVLEELFKEMSEE